MTLGLPSKNIGSQVWKNNRLFLLAILLFTVALVYRRADAFTNPQFWAEDGMVFFVEQDHHEEFIPFQNYNGYIHFIPRTVSYLAKLTQVPLEWVPTFYNYFTCLIYLIYFYLIWSFIPFQQRTRFFMISVIGFLPIAFEVYMNLTNVQWFSALILILLFFDLKIKEIRSSIGLSFFVLLAGLTGPFSMMFLPILIWKGWKWRTQVFNLIPLIIAVLTGLVQLLFLYNHFQGRLFPNIPVPHNHLWLTFYNAIKQVFLFDHRMIVEFKWKHWFAIVPIILLYLGSFLYSLKRKDETGILLLICIGLNVFFTVKANWPFEWLISPFLGGMRYFFLPFVLILWYIFQTSNQQKILPFIIYLLVIVMFFVHGKWVRSSFVDLNWKKEVQEYKTTGDLIIPINPVGWYVILKKK